MAYPIRIFVRSTLVDDRTVRSNKTGQDIRIRNQGAYVYGRSEMGMMEVRLRLAPEQEPYPQGVYEIAGSSVDVGEYGMLRIGFGGVALVGSFESDPHVRRCLHLVKVLEEFGEGIDAASPKATEAKK